jgi:molybdate transport system permease protein
MDWTAVLLSLELACWTLLVLLPAGLAVGRWLAVTRLRAKPWLEGLLALPLILPPTVIGFYLLVGLGANSLPGQLFARIFGRTLAFSFPGLVVASIIVNIPFVVQPIQRGFEAISPDIREAAQCCGLTIWQSLWKIEIPLAWPGILSAAAMAFAHTLGEFGVVLMVGGNIPGETRTVAIAIYDRVQAFDPQSAGRMAALLMGVSLAMIAVSYGVSARLMDRWRVR